MVQETVVSGTVTPIETHTAERHNVHQQYQENGSLERLGNIAGLSNELRRSFTALIQGAENRLNGDRLAASANLLPLDIQFTDKDGSRKALIGIPSGVDAKALPLLAWAFVALTDLKFDIQVIEVKSDKYQPSQNRSYDEYFWGGLFTQKEVKPIKLSPKGDISKAEACVYWTRMWLELELGSYSAWWNHDIESDHLPKMVSLPDGKREVSWSHTKWDKELTKQLLPLGSDGISVARNWTRLFHKWVRHMNAAENCISFAVKKIAQPVAHVLSTLTTDFITVKVRKGRKTVDEQKSIRVKIGKPTYSKVLSETENKLCREIYSVLFNSSLSIPTDNIRYFEELVNHFKADQSTRVKTPEALLNLRKLVIKRKEALIRFSQYTTSRLKQLRAAAGKIGDKDYKKANVPNGHVSALVGDVRQLDTNIAMLTALIADLNLEWDTFSSIGQKLFPDLTSDFTDQDVAMTLRTIFVKDWTLEQIRSLREMKDGKILDLVAEIQTLADVDTSGSAITDKLENDIKHISSIPEIIKTYPRPSTKVTWERLNIAVETIDNIIEPLRVFSYKPLGLVAYATKRGPETISGEDWKNRLLSKLHEAESALIYLRTHAAKKSGANKFSVPDSMAVESYVLGVLTSVGDAKTTIGNIKTTA
jgi:hypothetical protein